MVHTQRESGIELLRIFAAFGVVFSHFLNLGGIFGSDQINYSSYMVMTLIRSITIASVDIFVIITGFFLSTNQVRSLGKPLSLLFQVSIYSVIFTIAFYLIGKTDLSIRGILFSLLPSNWFVTLYVVLYIIFPYLNFYLVNLKYETWIYYLSIVLVLFSLLPMFLGIADHLGLSLQGLSTYGFGGNNAGYTLVNFITLYSIGAFCRLNEIEKKVKSLHLLFIAAVCILILWGIRFIPLNTKPWHIAGWYDNIFVLTLASCLFLIFKKLNFNSFVINSLSAAAFTCYIIQGYCLKMVSIDTILCYPLHKSLAVIAIFIICTYLFAFCIYYFYTSVFGSFFNKLDKKRIQLI